MPKKQHTEEQIISALKQYEGGEKTADICRKLGASAKPLFTCTLAAPVGAFTMNAPVTRSLFGESGRILLPCWALP